MCYSCRWLLYIYPQWHGKRDGISKQDTYRRVQIRVVWVNHYGRSRWSHKIAMTSYAEGVSSWPLDPLWPRDDAQVSKTYKYQGIYVRVAIDPSLNKQQLNFQLLLVSSNFQANESSNWTWTWWFPQTIISRRRNRDVQQSRNATVTFWYASWFHFVM